ncbi:S1 family peptidase [Micromonospora sp. WMMD882]|uniref:S1 family peptidase n=1 Tax=Micromonospora sp. WMMD882 TaxID=3015151 RepID=UPI00248BF433|nr:S1 family peptidase [Micromonospora sp. WMMD882]WBB80634.1 S1 family peptidase [Micromonospora sp. WMMD882]
MRRSPFVATVLAALVVALPGVAQARPAGPDPLARPVGSAPGAVIRAAAVLAGAAVPGTAWGPDPVTGRMTVTVDDTVTGDRLTALRATVARADAVLRHEPGRLTTLIAAGQAIYGNGGGRCSLGANVRRGSVSYFVTAGHCAVAGSTWYADSAQSTLLGVRAAAAFPGDDYGLVQYTNPAVPRPSAIHTYPGTITATGIASAHVGQRVCRSGATTGVRCGSVTGLNVTVNYAQGSVSGLIRTNICAEPGDSGGPLYDPATGRILGILSGGSGNCGSGGVSYYQPIGEILSAYGLTLP